jgi:phosphatidylinositol-4,5-bisphosphate 3-kinase
MKTKLHESINAEIPSVHHAKLIEFIENLDSLQELTEVQKGMMWIYRYNLLSISLSFISLSFMSFSIIFFNIVILNYIFCRYYCSMNSTLLSKFLRSVDWIKDVKKTEETRNLLVSWESLTHTIDSMELLDIRYSDPIVREWAISQNLDKLNDEDLNEILLQLVQVLKYEAYHDSPLARFLLYRSILSPHTIGHTFYWLLKSEMHNPLVRDRFGVLLMVYLKNCGIHCTTLQQQCELNDSLTVVTDSLKGKSKKIREHYVKEQLEILNSKLPSTFSLCLNPKIECIGVVIF